jgi:hypothetical protein
MIIFLALFLIYLAWAIWDTIDCAKAPHRKR